MTLREIIENIFNHRNNKTTLSVYVQDITVKVFDDETETVQKVTAKLYSEKPLSDGQVKSDFESRGLSVVGKIEKTLDEKQSGLYEMSHKEFVEHAHRVGDVRPKKEKSDK